MFLQRAFMLLMLFVASQLEAAHLVGGEITYECLGGGTYEVRLRVYRDCAGGGAAFDQFIEIRAFNALTQAFVTSSAGVSPGPVQTVPLNTGDPCLTIPAGLCTEYVEYVTTLNLPSSPDGYDITWQRCCRNGSISNIPNPGTWGNTYTVQIPPNDPCASSPVFNNTPPIVICANEPLSIDASATDADGDSLYYELCEILHGGSQFSPAPLALPPPYQNIPFSAPQTFDNPIPSNPQISIDSLTGIISGEANLQGQYVVGICVSSFRNGVFETRVRRDFQFNVSNCVRNVVSDMITQQEDSSLFCMGREIQFSNESSSSATSYLWDFGDTTRTDDTSTVQNPVFTYSRPGVYNVTLIVNPGTQCSDTVVEVFEIYETPEIEYGIFDGSVCFGVQDIYFGVIGNNIPPGARYEWYFGGSPPPNIPYWSGPFPPPITWPVPGEYPVTIVMKSNTCSDSVVDSVEIVLFNQVVDAGPDQIIVEGEDVQMNASGGVEYLWYADQPVYFSDPRRADALTRPINDTTTYYVEVTTADGCQGIDSMQVFMVSANYPNPDYDRVPNVITPNGDGANDYLDLSEIVRGRDVRFVLHNRWGSVVYEEEGYRDQWGGQSAGGDPLPDGTYYYILQEGVDVIHKAPVTIIRNSDE